MPASFANSHLSSSTNLKRKAYNDDDNIDHPRKLPAIAEHNASRPLQQNRSAINVSKLGVGPPPLTKPRGPAITTARTTRATSAPLKPSAVPRPASRVALASRTGVARTTSGPLAPTVISTQFQTLQSQVASIEHARAADVARLAADMDSERSKVAELQANHLAMSRELATARTQELSQRRDLVNASDELDALRKKHAREVMDIEMDLKKRDREIRELNEDLRIVRGDLERERDAGTLLKATVAQQSTAQITLQAQNSALQAQIGALQSSCDFSADTVTKLRLDLEMAQKRVEVLEQDAREAEMVRRRLHNMVQELKGNIRVFCRVRPLLPSDLPTNIDDVERARAEALANVVYPDQRDHREIVLSASSESATGQERKETWSFGFDKVFEPHSTQAEVFEEISQLAQSCTDGYNVCIFAYGQTGSGKSFTMEGGSASSTVGMIPRAVDQVFQATEDLKSKGWEYTLEGQFLEIYNETINDLLGNGEFDKKKHEIKHDKSGTRVTDVVVQALHSPAHVRALLARANSRRTVAATLMNERSSRSHSVFTLRIRGTNALTGEACSGALNLVDLAGSERLNASGAGSDKERLKETQSINKSLSALGDVIAALGEKSEKGDKHIPYRNSKLTYLLQNSLSGNSKTLMVLNLSPLAAHLNESLCSLRFATKVNNTTIGTAKKQTKSTS
ncbi:kinesin-domain-containing protein [Auriscalpium vulgare]|uniref:Kinesin-domain-containing protein n=1 Tax=Auriscalpium vulgare TaxID=40419 RepID=A0ACB8RPG2_9AGAM|nr:kinesin-domain-containing protein [Auriscalpium vulgare]